MKRGLLERAVLRPRPDLRCPSCGKSGLFRVSQPGFLRARYRCRGCGGLSSWGRIGNFLMRLVAIGEGELLVRQNLVPKGRR